MQYLASAMLKYTPSIARLITATVSSSGPGNLNQNLTSSGALILFNFETVVWVRDGTVLFMAVDVPASPPMGQ